MVTKDALNDAVTEAIKDYDARRRVVEERVPMMYAFVGPDGTMPLRAKELDACYDVYSAQTILVPPGKPTKISTQLYLEVPAGWEVQIRPRSGLSINHGISVANTPGTVDATYTNEVCVGLVNHTDTAYVVNKGDRIAQIQYVRLAGAEIIPSPFDTLEEFHEHLAIKFGEDSRGLSGFGSTGK
jgi:dUTP pyrophosphatase